MRTHIMNFVKTIILTLMCSVSLISSIKVFADSSTINTNPDFIQDYYLTAGTTYAKDYADLTYKMVKVEGQQQGMFKSKEGSILYVQVSVEGLPAGLTFEQGPNDRDHPVLQTLYFYGTIPATTPPGIYEVTVTGVDQAKKTNTATQIIKLHIGSAIPQPTQTSLQITGKVGETPNSQNMSNYFQLPTGAAQIDQYKVTDISKLPPNITLSNDGNFIGTYSQAGTFNDVLVSAHNESGWSAPLNVSFYISQTDVPPYPQPTSTTVNGVQGAAVGAEANMSQYFHTNTGSSPITAYRVVDATKLPPGVTGISAAGVFEGTYSQVGNYSGTQVEAQNAAGWSAPLAVIFNITTANSAPFPKSTTPLNVEATVNSTPTVANMSTYFTVNSGSPAITEYRVVDLTKLPPAITLSPSGDFIGTYNQVGVYNGVAVQAKNSVGWSASYIINFNVTQADAPPTPLQQTLPVSGIVGDAISVLPMSHYFQTTPTSSPISSYQISGSPLPPNIQFSTSTGTFSGTYQTAGTYNNVLITAVNNAGVSSPLTVNFTIAQTDSVPFPKSADVIELPGRIHNAVSISNMSTYFDINPGASRITEYGVVDASKLPTGISFNPDGSFSGTYGAMGSYPNVQIRAKNAAGWSAAKVINFTIADTDLVPYPVSTTPLEIHAKQHFPITLKDVKDLFAIHPGSSAIIDYQAENLPLGIRIKPNGELVGFYSEAGVSTAQIRAENAAGLSAPYEIKFTVDAPTTLACPDPHLVENASCGPITVNDSQGNPHTFTMVYCDGTIMYDFVSAELRANATYNQGLVCTYNSLNSQIWMYVLNPVPAEAYYGDSLSNTNTTCTSSAADCKINIP